MDEGREKEGLGSLRWAGCQAFCCRAAGAWGGSSAQLQSVPSRGQPNTGFCYLTNSSGFLICSFTHFISQEDLGWILFTPNSPSSSGLSEVGWSGHRKQRRRVRLTPCLSCGPTSKPHSPAFPGTVTTMMP